jgi:cytoskeletal protein RodZ
MSEKNETDVKNAQEHSKDRVGDIIRKERITRRITVETIAKDLKLNVGYIKALEASEYESLPADPYVRVYLRSLAKYLSLDSEEILKKFYEERGMNIEHIKPNNSNKITISVKDKEPQGSPKLMIIIILIIILIAFSFIASKKGWIPAPQTPSMSNNGAKLTSAVESLAVNDSLLDDSLFSGAPVQPADTEALKANTTSDKKIPAETGTPAKKMTLRIEAIKDSVWAQVFSDGQSWKNYIYVRQPKDFSAADSFNVNVGHNAHIKYNLNGKQLKVKGDGVVVFKVDTSRIPSIWGYTKWKTVFRNRE